MTASRASTDDDSEYLPGMFEVLRARRIFSLGYYFKSFLTEGPFTFVWIVVDTHPTLSAAQQQAADLSLKESSATFAVRQPDGVIGDYSYDCRLDARRRRFERWFGTILTAILLSVVSYAVAQYIGLPVSHAAIVTAISSGVYLLASLDQNRLESLVVWCIVAVLICIGYPVLQKATQKRERIRALQAQPQAIR